MLRADTGPRQIALRKVAPCDQYTRNLHAARYESPGLGAHCLLVCAHMPARAVPHGIASLAMICPAAAVGSPAHWSCTARGDTARHGARKWRRHVKECSDDLAATSEQVQDLCCGLRNVNPLACRYRHDHPPATSLASITNSWQHGAAQRVPCLSMEGSRCAKGLVYSLSLNRCVDACTWQSRLTVLDAALVVVQPGASIAARCTLKFPGIDPSCASVAAAVIPAHQPAGRPSFFCFRRSHSRRRFGPQLIN